MRSKEEIQKKIQERIMKAQQGHLQVQGDHIYLFENHRNHDLSLPRRSFDGKTLIPPRGRFKGDEYFLMLQKSGQVRLVSSEPYIKSVPAPAVVTEQKAVEKVEVIKENTQEKTMEKLILDQPDRVTVQGHTEHVVQNQPKPLNDNNDPEAKKGDVLLTENPLDGIDIING